MFQFLRSKFGPAVVGVIIGFIAFVFIFFGVFTPKMGGMGGSGSAATVNGDPISLQEFAQSYEQRIRFYQSMMKGKADANLLRQLGLKKAVLDDLVRQKLLIQEASKMGFAVSDAEVAARIKALPYFQKDGRFDKDTYEKLLKANNQVPSRFEDMVRQDLLAQRVSDFMRNRVRVSDQELMQEFEASGDQRQVDYVLVSLDDAKKKISVSAQDIDAFLKDKGNENAAKLFYEQNKYRYVKSKKPADKPEFKTFDEVRRDVAADLAGAA